MTGRISILGLDGLSYRYFEKMLRAATLPNLSWIHGSGMRAYLEAFPPMTPPSWTSIMTGVDPAGHGIYDFTEITESEGGLKMLISARGLRHPRIHEMLDVYGVRSIVINPFPPYPLYPLKNSIQISNAFFTPTKVYSPERASKYASKLSHHENVEGFEDALVKAVKYLSEYIEVAEELVEKEDHELFWIALPYPDHYLHKAGNPRMLGDVTHNLEIEVFKRIDELAGILRRNSDTMLIVSDHGFSSYKYYINVNTYLFLKGYTKPRGSMGVVGGTASAGGLSRIKLAATRFKLVKKIIGPIYRRLTGGTGEEAKPLLVDTEASTAYMTSHTSFAVRVRDHGLLEKVFHDLEGLEGIKGVYMREEVFKGPWINLLPEIYVEPDYDQEYFVGSEKIWTTILSRAQGEEVLNHHPRGVFMIAGRVGFRQLSGEIPNYLVGNIIMNLMDKPVSTTARGIELLRKMDPLNEVRATDVYMKRWSLLKRLERVRRK